MQGIGFFNRAHLQARYRHQHRRWPPLLVMLRELTGLAALIVLISASLAGLSVL